MKDTMKRTVRWSGIAAVAASAASAVSFFTTRYLVKIALDREEPKAAQLAETRISGSMKENAFIREVNDTAEKLAAKQNEKIEITASDGTTLIGHWIPCQNAKRAIIAMHGWRSAWYRDFGMISDFWERNDCSVLYAEQRGQNGSGGEYISFGLLERYDCLDWIKWVTERCGTTVPVYLGGVSMGATTVLMAAELGLPENIHGIISDCGFTSVHDIWKHVANKNLHLTYGIRGAVADALFKKKFQMGTEECSTVEALKKSSVPVMLIHGTEDHFVPVEMTYENYQACCSQKHLLVVPGADHGMSYFLEKERYEASVKEFWKKYDGCD